MKVYKKRELIMLVILLFGIIILQTKVQANTASIDVSTTEDFINAAKDENIKTINITSDEINFNAGTIVLNVTGKTINLQNHTIKTTNMGFILEGDNFTLKNGKIIVTNNGSYCLFIGDEDSTNGAVIENIEGEGGFNIYNTSNVVLKNCKVTGSNYYAIWCDYGGKVIVESGTYTSSKTAILGLSSVGEPKLEIKGGNYITNGKSLVLTSTTINYGKPEISDGTFDVEVDEQYCKSGYEPVSIGSNKYSVCNHSNTRTSNRKEATCTEKGYTGDVCCKKCGKKLRNGSSISAKGHSVVHHKEVPASCTENGTKEYWSCKQCNKNFKDENASQEIDNIEILALGHLPSEWKSDEESHWKECTREDCKTIIIETKELHNKKDGKCEVCLREMPPKIENIVDDKSNVKLEYEEEVLPKDVVLEIEKVINNDIYNKAKEKLTEVEKIELFDINLLKDGIKIQPSGKIKISIPVPENFDKSKLVVYRIEENQNIEYEVTVVTIEGKDYAQFETSHFSYYVLGEKLEANSDSKDTTLNGEKKLENEPKTGVISTMTVTTVVLTISIIGYVVCKKKMYKASC